MYPHGSTDSLPYATMGSGSLNAMAVFEEGYKDGLERDEAVALVARAIRSGIFNDLGSGSNVDVCVIMRGKVRGAGATWKVKWFRWWVYLAALMLASVLQILRKF